MHTDMIGYKIRLIHNQIHKRMEAKKQENEKEPLTGMQRWTLGFLRDHDGKDIYQKDIETEFSVSRATASNMLAVMERKGLVRRETVEHDARLKKLVLTDKARTMVERSEQDMREMEALLEKGLSDEEVKDLKKYLDRMLLNLDVDITCPKNSFCGGMKK
ncbi:MarR family winged helix-turn-helix transcriptional regulator [Roseburia intestinalis]|jgi:MarR family transcriptional repressor of mepA|uniref:MarR family winged helix-turn-helix transcriptional regulator n=1 Tax=Roseburia intestinalis TaxID=166486 RepID=UPI001FAB12F2|nr:MarR family winged helix-turn-helix transcriptional regulator [Roseburia intestinalis]